MELNTQSVLALAPDASSAAAGRKNSAAKFWKNLGRSDVAIWGECLGSALYQVKIDQRQFAFNCTCPSRKLPCKHVLGLLLLTCETPDAVPLSSPPEWVTTWLDKRDATAKKKEEKSAAQASLATETNNPDDSNEIDASHSPTTIDKTAAKATAKAKRSAKRDAAVLVGIEQLDLFLSDLVRQGFAGLERKGRSFWEQQAQRLVDAQAKGLANRLRRMGEIPASGADWPSRLLSEASGLQLLTQGAGVRPCFQVSLFGFRLRHGKTAENPI